MDAQDLGIWMLSRTMSFQQALNANFHIAHLKRFRDMIICALTETVDNVVWGAIGRHNDNRGAAMLAYLGAYRMAVPIG
jgi:hypothetical protein